LITSLRQDAYNRPLDWRWQLAGQVVDNQTPLPSDADLRLVQAVFFQRELAACENDAQRQRVAAACPALSQAHKLWRSGPLLLRLEVEARILARESFQVIAWKTGLTPATVAAYEALFFHVTDRLQATGWITHQVIGPALHSALQPDDIRVFWFFYAYHGGVLPLEQLIDDLLQNGGEDYRHVLRARLADSNLPAEKRAMYRAIRLRMLRFSDPKVAFGLCYFLFMEHSRYSWPQKVDHPEVTFPDAVDELLDELQPAEAA